MNSFLVGLGYMIALVSSFFVIAAISDLIGGSKTETGILIGLLIFFLGTGYGGIALAMSRRKKRVQALQQTVEDEVLAVIAKRGGRVTPLELAAQTTFTADECKALLDSLCDRGFGTITVTERGNIVYQFDGFISDEEKRTALDPLDE